MNNISLDNIIPSKRHRTMSTEAVWSLISYNKIKDIFYTQDDIKRLNKRNPSENEDHSGRGNSRKHTKKGPIKKTSK